MTPGMQEPINDWNYPGAALILSMEDLERRRESIGGVVALTSGGYDPIHPGHISLITEAKSALRHNKAVPDDLSIRLVVLVNDDGFLQRKKGKAFMDHKTRCQIVAGIRGVDYVVPFIPTDSMDSTVSEGISRLRPNFFIKGGDRNCVRTLPERDAAVEADCVIVTGVGQDKLWSSSNFLADWEYFAIFGRHERDN